MMELSPGMFGWQRDLPDHRDYEPSCAEVTALLTPLSGPPAGSRLSQGMWTCGSTAPR